MDPKTQGVEYYSREAIDMEQRVRPEYRQEQVADLLLEHEDVDVVYVALAFPDKNRAEWKLGQEVVHVPGFWVAQRHDADQGVSAREAETQANLLAAAWLQSQGRVGSTAAMRISRYAGQTLHTAVEGDGFGLLLNAV